MDQTWCFLPPKSVVEVIETVMCFPELSIPINKLTQGLTIYEKAYDCMKSITSGPLQNTLVVEANSVLFPCENTLYTRFQKKHNFNLSISPGAPTHFTYIWPYLLCMYGCMNYAIILCIFHLQPQYLAECEMTLLFQKIFSDLKLP